MGLRSASEVPDFFFIKNPTGTTKTRSSMPAIGVTVTGTRQNVSISQITAIEGTRPFGFTGVNPTTIWRQAFLLLVGAGTTPSSADMSKINTVRSAWIPYFANAVEGRGSISTNLGTTPSLPDLVSSINPVPSTGTVGGTIQLSVSVVNQGAGAAGAFRLGLYFSSDATITTGDLFFAFCQISGLAAGSSTTCSGPVTIPASLSPGVYFVGVIADDQGTVGESNETNNTALTGPITVTAASPPSAAVILNGSVFHSGQSITYQATLTPGSTPAQVDIYLGALLPDGITFLSLVQVSPGVISFVLGPSPVPFQSNVTLAPVAVPFSYIFAGFEPTGTYFAYAGLVVAGTNPLQSANQLSLGFQAFQLVP
jgi:hypothetical protein